MSSNATTPVETKQPRRSEGGFFSSARRFSLPVGPHLERDEVRGYYIDLRIKAEEPSWPPEWLPPPAKQLHVDVIQWGLGCYERYLAGEGEQWLEAARDCALHYLDIQEREGPKKGGWIHPDPFPHTFPLGPGWLSSMAQGEGASLLVRLYLETLEERFARAAALALEPLERPSDQGGVISLLDRRPFPEEYPTDPPSYVLNGAIFTLWGWYDVGVGLKDERALQRFEEGLDTLVRNLHRWDVGYWSRYDLFPHPIVNVASSSYHVLHINQLKAMSLIAPRPELDVVAARFERYLGSRLKRARAFAMKALFRLLVPRNRLLAGRLPWLWRHRR
jgi:heparosan-N-sulfate-glucuronate 5-epimerase